MFSQNNHLYEFGSFRLNPEEHLLLQNGQPVRMPPKTFELLLFFVHNNNQVIDKETLMQEVWRDTFVEEANLTVHISTIRKILADDSEKAARIETFPKRGYRFTANVRELVKENSLIARNGHIKQAVANSYQKEEDSQNQPDKLFLFQKKQKMLILSVLVVLIAALVTLGYFKYSDSNSPTAITSVAVLPFVNETGNPENEYLSDGMTEILINNLSQLPNLSVKARSSVFRYKGKDVNPKTIGNELLVQAILLGRIGQKGDLITLSLELVDTRTENIIWSGQYSRPQTDLVSLQSEIARNISSKIRTKLSGAEERSVAKNYTKNSEAYQLYLKGHFYWNRRTVEDFRKAIGYFQQSVEIDPDFALAYSGLSDSYNLLASYNGGDNPRDTMPQAKAAALKALELDETLAEAHGSLGQYLANYEHDKVGAEYEFKRAIELNPNYVSAYQWYAELLEGKGRFDEALTQLRRAAELDLLSRIIKNIFGRILLETRRYDEAIAQFKKNIDFDPTWGGDHDLLFHIYAAQGKYAEAVEAYIQAMTLFKIAPPAEIQATHESFAKSGWQEFLRHRLKYLEEQSKREYIKPMILAEFYARLGENAKAFAALNEALETRTLALGFLKYLPVFDSLRSDPRYDKLIHRAELPR